MQLDLTPDQAQMLINCLQYSLQRQIEDGNKLIALLQLPSPTPEPEVIPDAPV